jgi:hypothetical protein
MAYIGGTYTADPNNVAGDYTPVPPGEYGFTIIEADYKENNAKTGHFIYIKAKIDDNDPSGEGGRTFEDRFNIDNPNEKAVEIGQRQLNALLFATGKQAITDTDELLGLSAIAKLKVDPAKPYMKDGVQQPGSPSNSVGAYKARGAAANSAPAAPAQQTGGAAVPPWKRNAA